jgi:hypothetical protein
MKDVIKFSHNELIIRVSLNKDKTRVSQNERWNKG